ncbi:DUF3891 family protein [Roseivirga sp. BDSF3-8]|uniref:DUF3891 family protein n=1 Tax=Roseivirga sp. BDSF3-8 TaxID=3241598 RepID=UPI003531D8B9
MIVNMKEKGWEIIFQRAHGLLAAKLADKIREELWPPPQYRVDTLAAIAEHDDGQPGWEGKNHISDTGAPLNFTFHGVDLKQARKVVQNGIYKSKWIALLTSMHTSSLYAPFADREEVATFLNEQEAHQKKLRHYLSISKEEVEKHYKLMRWCDEFSLILCQDRIPKGGKKLEIGKLPDGTSRWVYAKESLLVVTPWCFEEKEVEVYTEARGLEKLSFRDDKELLAAIRAEKPYYKKWTLVPN